MTRTFRILFGHEVRSLLLSPGSWLATTLFLLLMGLFYLMALHQAAERIDDILPNTLFFNVYFVPVLFMIPLLTMRSFAEEHRLGTLGTLMTTPVRASQVVLAKFLAAYTLYLGMWSLTLAFPFLVDRVAPDIAEAAQLFDRPSLYGGFAFVAVSGALHTAVGLFCSSMTRSQLVAGMLSFCFLLLIVLASYFVEQVRPEAVSWALDLGLAIEYLQPLEHLRDFSRGVLDSRPFVLYVSNSLLLLGLTTLNVEART